MRYIEKGHNYEEWSLKKKFRVIAYLTGDKSPEFATRIAMDDRRHLAG